MWSLRVCSGHSLPPLLTVRHFAAATEAWSYDTAGDDEEDGRALARKAARLYHVAARFEAVFKVLLSAQAEIERNDRVLVHLVANIDYVSDVLDRDLLKVYNIHE